MKLSVRNLGRIREAEVDLRPLTVLVGQNDTNKTWLAYAFAALASRVACTPPRIFERREESTEYFPELNAAISALNGQVQSQFDLQAQIDRTATDEIVRVTVDLNEYLRSVGPEVAVTLKDYHLRDWFAISPELIEGAEVSLRLETAASWATRYNSISIQHSALSPSQNGVQSNRSSYRFEKGLRSELVIECPGTLYRDIVAAQVKTILRRFATTAFDRDFTFPVDRVGLARVRKYLKSEFFLRPPSGMPSTFPQPMIRFVEWYDLTLAQTGGSESEFLTIFEDTILGGEFVVAPDKGQIQFRPKGIDKDFDLPHASSMINALSALGLYLRSGSLQMDCLIIDEPELDAHPEAQLQVLELLAMLANSGVQVVITTHSPYLLDHLHDLMEAARLTPEKQAEVAGRFKLGESRAFIDAEKVAVYEFVNEGASVTVNSVLDRTDSLIDTATFSNPTNYLNALYPDLLQLSPAEQAE